MLAHAFLSITTTTQTQQQTTPPTEPSNPSPMIPLTRNEIRHLITQLTNRIQRSRASVLHWSIWRRRHQARARASLWGSVTVFWL